jgi:hypothetical protein
MWTEAQDLNIVRTALDTVFFQEFEYDSSDPMIATAQDGELFKVIDIDRQAYIGETNAPVGLFAVIGEVASVPADIPVTKTKYTVPVLDFAKKIVISKDLFDDNQHDVWAENVREMGRMARVSQDDHAFALFRTAFTTSVAQSDGVAMCSAAHVLVKNGAAASNLVTGALNSANLNSAMVSLREQVNQAGVILGSAPAYLLVPAALWKTALEETDSALIADNGNNAINVWRSAFGFKVKCTPYLGAASGGSDTAWFLLTKFHGIRRLVRQGIETALTPWSFSDNRTYTYQANFREEVYCADWAGLVGSTGL